MAQARLEEERSAFSVPAKKSQNLQVIHISNADLAANTTSLDTIQTAVELFHRDGVCAVANAIPQSVVSHLREKMLHDIGDYLKKPVAHFNQGRAALNISMTPPLTKEYVHRSIWANTHALSVLEHILGPNPELRFVNSNIALENVNRDARQAVHSDAYHAHPDFPWCGIVNIYLQDVHPENGSTELWPGTHRFTKEHHKTADSGWIKREHFVKQAQHSPPFQPTLPAGTILIRDMRTWHAGRPNMTPDPRIMLTFVYFPKYWRCRTKIQLPMAVREEAKKWDHVDIETGTEWKDGEIDHLGLEFEANWYQVDEGFGGGANGVVTAEGNKAEPEVTRADYWTEGETV